MKATAAQQLQQLTGIGPVLAARRAAGLHARKGLKVASKVLDRVIA